MNETNENKMINFTNAIGEKYSYNLKFNTKLKRYDIEEYKNDVFFSHVFETYNEINAKVRFAQYEAFCAKVD